MVSWKDAMGPAADVFSAGMDYVGAHQDRQAQKGLANQQHLDRMADMAMQKEFAQNGIRWRVADAEAAGLHPLAALGAMGAGYQPGSITMSGDPGSGEAFRSLSRMGQNLSRAARATQTTDERAMINAQLDKLAAESEQARAIAGHYRAMQNPATPPMPQRKIEVMNPDGSISIMDNPDLAGAVMADPLGMYGSSIEGAVRRFQRSPKYREFKNRVFAPDYRGWRTKEAEIYNPRRNDRNRP